MRKLLLVVSALVCTLQVQAAQPLCSDIMTWKGKQNTLHDSNKLSLSLGNSNQFFQVSDRVMNSFPALRGAVIAGRSMVNINSITTANVSLVKDFLNISHPDAYASFLTALPDDKLKDLNVVISELGGVQAQKPIKVFKYGYTPYDEQLTSLVAQNLTKGNAFVQISKEIKGSIPRLQSTEKSAIELADINADDPRAKDALVFIVKYATLLYNNAISSLGDLINSTDARVIACARPALVKMYGDKLIGFDGHNVHVSAAKWWYNNYGQPLMNVAAVVIVLIAAYAKFKS